jgi:hypothetical protein
MGEELTMATVTDDRSASPVEPGLDRGDLGRPVRGRTLWVIFGSLLLLGGFWWGAFSVVDVLAHEQRTERFVVPAEELTGLLVDNDSGSVTIVGTDTDEVNVEAQVSEGLRDTGFRHEVVGSTLELHGSCPVIGSTWCRVTYLIEVPRGIDVDVNADNDRVEVRNIDGSVVVNSDNGAVELADVSGEINVDGDNGRVDGIDLTAAVVDVGTDNGRIELAFTEPPDTVIASGDNGSIEIVVPEVENGYDVAADTDNGEVDLTTVNDNPESPHKLRLETDNGSITVRTVG